MHYNCTFTTYRRETASGKRQYAAAATITNGDGFIEPASPNMSATLGLDLSVRPYILRTEESDFEKYDRITISSVNYYVDGVEVLDLNGVSFARLVLLKDE